MIDLLDNPTPAQLGRSPDEFLQKLENSTLIRVDGRDRSRTRALATLLHGNEPSGFLALHKWLLQQQTPAVNLVCFIGSVLAAKLAPGFSYRQLPGGRDFNRCFKQPFDGIEGQTAAALLDILHEAQPEALVDIHNTSGTGPSFAISVRNDGAHQALATLFTERLIITDLKLGALMEYSERDVPTVTIECGGAQDEHAHQTAYEGLLRFVNGERILQPEKADWGLEVLTNPVRIEIEAEASLAYELQPAVNADITLFPDIEHLNFGVVSPETQLGWVGPQGLDCFVAVDGRRRDIRHKLLRVEAGKLYPAQPFKAFMITTNPTIAKSDCLFYAVSPRGEPIA
ncbi:succinylglutamate desuccinylase [Pseudomaricurvus alcaniphilus]|uniref:succinylglutamate desuccinylase/aspartoacylase domain-containing protein n=1 Tax=Pseudomaricurvus alcaniphilus TaxID=1166482 RepID=UPI00140CA292|nr:succinylglutamate desuccinylase/aspartoacylase family protein [Pseudomaricurvus alcaniphilus]NHN39840.1 succinylglutamate desuccinylase [Pseudomaricurvus alcaniphilus]